MNKVGKYAMKVLDLKTFVPAKDFALSRRFYADLGFTENWVSEEGKVAELQVGEFRFLLQNYYVQQFAENFMMHLMVENADAWWRHVSETKLAEKYPGIMAKAPAVRRFARPLQQEVSERRR